MTNNSWNRIDIIRPQVGEALIVRNKKYRSYESGCFLNQSYTGHILDVWDRGEKKDSLLICTHPEWRYAKQPSSKAKDV